MNAAQLLAHFDRISEAPDAVPRLRRFILDLAVRGKLVEQDPNDEPASALLKRIRREQGPATPVRETKRPSLPLEAEPEPWPFAVPYSWAWTTLGLVSYKLTDGSHNPPTDAGIGNGFPMLSSQNVLDGTVNFSNPTRHVSAADFALENARSQIRPGDVLLTIVGSIGRSAVVPETAPNFTIQRSVAVVASHLCPAFLSLQLRSPTAQLYFGEHGKGTAQRGIYLGKLARMPVAVPPLAEQHRIVAKVDELMALCDRLEAAQAERETCRDRLVAASLSRLNEPASGAAAGDSAGNGAASSTFADHARFHLCHLPRFATRPEHIRLLRRAILDLAVRGKLVEQDPTDEPAAELLKRIVAEKARLSGDVKGKLGRPLARVEDDAARSSTPPGWRVAKAGDLLTFVTSGSRGWAAHYSSEGAIFLRIGNLDYGTTDLDLSNVQYVRPPRNAEGTRTLVQEGDLLVSITGDTGMIGLVPSNLPAAYINQHIALARPSGCLYRPYLAKFLTSPAAQAQLKASQRGIKNSLGLDDIRNVVVPLPPLAEQRRIVAKVDGLMALCDRLETQLTTARTESRRLLEAVLQQALHPVA